MSDPPHRRSNLPHLVERWLPGELGGSGFPPPVDDLVEGLGAEALSSIDLTLREMVGCRFWPEKRPAPAPPDLSEGLPAKARKPTAARSTALRTLAEAGLRKELRERAKATGFHLCDKSFG